MEVAPPSYEQATSTNVLSSVAPLLSTNDLCNAVLVCHKWYNAFAPHIWGNPGARIDTESRRWYAVFGMLRDALHFTRAEVRNLTYSLQLPVSSLESYDQDCSELLYDIFDRLPYLQALLACDSPFFNHTFLQTMNIRASLQSKAFGLRLLDASRCPDVTSHDLAAVFVSLPNLIYLDLSFTFPAREARVLKSMQRLTSLRILKLRGLGMSDDDIQTLAVSIGTRIKSLDVRDNRGTSNAIQALRKHCMTTTPTPVRQYTTEDSAPSYAMDTSDFGVCESEALESYVRTACTSGFMPRLIIEDMSSQGLTHLYVSGNLLDLVGTITLVSSDGLNVLDIGALSAGPVDVLESKEAGSLQSPANDSGFLTELIKHTSLTLTHLRISLDVLFPRAGAANSATQLHPAMIPHVITLVVTNIPTSTEDAHVTQSIIAFIKQCADQEHIARRRAEVDYGLPPGRRQDSAIIEYMVSRQFALKHIVLEVSAPKTSSMNTDPGHATAQHRPDFSDSDAYAQWGNGQSDFSFFDDDPQDPQSPLVESGHIGWTSRAVVASNSVPVLPVKTRIDTVDVISKFRRDARHAQYKAGGGDHVSTDTVNDHWSGIVRVIRE